VVYHDRNSLDVKLQTRIIYLRVSKMCLPGSLTLVLRNFAKNLEGWLDMAMANVAKEMVLAKVRTAESQKSWLLFRTLYSITV